MTCDCIEKTNQKLAEHNTELDLALTFSGRRYIRIQTAKVDKKIRKGPMTLMASFCPFCGEPCEAKEAKAS